MTNSPLRLSLSGLFICILLAATLDFINVGLFRYTSALPAESSVTSDNSLSIARYYWRIGKFDNAIEEYQRVIPNLTDEELKTAYGELERLILLDKSTSGRIIGQIAYYAWLLPPRLYALAGLFLILCIIALIYTYAKKTPLFIIQPFTDHSGLNISNDLSKLAMDRIHEINWRAQNLENASNLITDNVEIPTLSLMSEGDNQGAVELLEVALMFSIGSNNLPFSHMISAIRLWLDQPLFLVRGAIDKRGQTIDLKISLIDRKKNSVEKIWCIELPWTENFTPVRIVDATIYPLLFYFNSVSATRWESLQALHIGLEEFELFKDNPSELAHLQIAREKLEHALDLDPGYGIAKYNLSLILLATGEFEKARDYFKELSANSEDPQLKLRAQYNHGVALFMMSQDWAYDQSVKIFKELLIKNEENSHG